MDTASYASISPNRNQLKSFVLSRGNSRKSEKNQKRIIERAWCLVTAECSVTFCCLSASCRLRSAPGARQGHLLISQFFSFYPRILR